MKNNVWQRKKTIMKAKGHLVIKRECQWKKEWKSLENIKTNIPRILNIDTEESLINAIRDGSVFGFITVDVTTPESIIQERDGAGFLFPPVIQRMVIEEKHLSPYMKQKFITDERKLEKTPTVVQTYHATQVFVMTEMARVWMNIGLKISNITQFVQYVPGKTLLPFTEKVTGMRCQATRENDEAKATTAKLYGNSGKS